MDSTGARTGYSVPVGRNGVTELAQYPDDFQPYTGRQRHTSVFVGGGPAPPPPAGPRLVWWGDKEAIAYARQTGLRLHHLPTSQLCHTAMTEFFGE
jgi:hypothetical protein